MPEGAVAGGTGKASPAVAPWATSPVDPRVLGTFFAIGAGCFLGPFVAVGFIPTEGGYPFPWGPMGLLLVVANVLGAAALMGRLRASYVLVGLLTAGFGAFTAYLVAMWSISSILGHADV